MATVSVLLLLLSAFSPPVHSRLSTFQIIPSDMNQTAARAACRENYIDLVTVYSDEDNTDLYNMTKTYRGAGWIGLYRSNFSEKWSNADPVTFRNLAGDCGTLSYCATMKADGGWDSIPCTETRYFMCYEEGDIKSKPNYHLILERKTWSGAQRYCRGNYTDLVSIRDQQQNEEVKIKGLNSKNPFWIGLLCDDWQWTDGGNSAYRNWASGQPQSSPSDCVVVLSEWGWISAPCSNDHYPLCYSISIHVSDEALSWEEALDYCREGNRAGILNIDSESEQEQLESELRRRRVPPGNLWVGLGPNRLSEMKVSSGPLTCEDVERQTEPPLSHCAADTHAAEAAPDYVMNSAELRVVCKLK